MYIHLRERALSPEEAADRSVRADGSVGGTFAHTVPYAEAGDTWPSCARCGRSYDLVYQVDAREGPWSAEHSGLYSIFVCSRCLWRRDDAIHHPIEACIRRYPAPMATRRVHIAPPPEWEPDPVVLEPADEFESPEAAFGWLACDEWWMGGVSMRWPCRCGRALRVLCKIGDVSLAGPYSLELVACACTPHDVDLIVLRDKG